MSFSNYRFQPDRPEANPTYRNTEITVFLAGININVNEKQQPLKAQFEVTQIHAKAEPSIAYPRLGG